jgi:hypothetical protein
VVQSFFSILYKEVSGLSKPAILPLLSSELKNELKCMEVDGALSIANTRVNRPQL